MAQTSTATAPPPITTTFLPSKLSVLSRTYYGCKINYLTVSYSYGNLFTD